MSLGNSLDLKPLCRPELESTSSEPLAHRFSTFPPYIHRLMTGGYRITDIWMFISAIIMEYNQYVITCYFIPLNERAFLCKHDINVKLRRYNHNTSTLIDLDIFVILRQGSRTLYGFDTRFNVTYKSTYLVL